LSGYFVVVPDFLHGDPYTPENAERPRPVWIKSHAPKKGFEEAKPVIAALKEKGVSAVGAAGYCWGGIVVVELAKAHEIQVAVVVHPGPITDLQLMILKRSSARFRYLELRSITFLHQN